MVSGEVVFPVVLPRGFDRQKQSQQEANCATLPFVSALVDCGGPAEHRIRGDRTESPGSARLLLPCVLETAGGRHGPPSQKSAQRRNITTAVCTTRGRLSPRMTASSNRATVEEGISPKPDEPEPKNATPPLGCAGQRWMIRRFTSARLFPQ
jgi:hypothetical protein